MSVEELNFKKMSNEKYRIYRLLQSPSSLVETYRARIKQVGQYRGAIIFPEQFISLYGQAIYRAQVSRKQDNVSVGLSMHRNFALYGEGHKDGALRTFDEVLEVERNSGHLESKMFGLKMEMPKAKDSYMSHADYDIKFDANGPVYWFSNKNDGLSFLRKNLTI